METLHELESENRKSRLKSAIFNLGVGLVAAAAIATGTAGVASAGANGWGSDGVSIEGYQHKYGLEEFGPEKFADPLQYLLYIQKLNKAEEN